MFLRAAAHAPLPPPSIFATACTTMAATPVPADPAPANTIFSFTRSPGLRPRARSEASIPASATPAVPWMSSLNMRQLPLYLLSSLSAWRVWKSSNWTRQLGHRL